MTDANCAFDQALLANIAVSGESLLHNLEQAARGIGFDKNVDKTEFLSFQGDETISTLSGTPLKLVDQQYLISRTAISHHQLKAILTYA